MLNAKVGTFPSSYAVISSLISCFTTFYCIDPYFICKLTIFKNTSSMFSLVRTLNIALTLNLAYTVWWIEKLRGPSIKYTHADNNSKTVKL